MELSTFHRRTMIVNGLCKRDDTHHALCPVNALREYLLFTNHWNSSRHFISPTSGVDCNKGQVNCYVRKLIRFSQPRV